MMVVVVAVWICGKLSDCGVYRYVVSARLAASRRWLKTESVAICSVALWRL